MRRKIEPEGDKVRIIIEFDGYTEKRSAEVAMASERMHAMIEDSLEELRRRSKYDYNPEVWTTEQVRNWLLAKIKEAELENFFF